MDGGNFGDCVTAAVVDEKGDILGAVVFSEYRKTDIQISIAADSKRWLSKKIVRDIFSYPFFFLGCNRATSYTAENCANVQDILIKFGFRKEGVLRKALNCGDALIYGMLREECKWIK